MSWFRLVRHTIGSSWVALRHALIFLNPAVFPSKFAHTLTLSSLWIACALILDAFRRALFLCAVYTSESLQLPCSVWELLAFTFASLLIAFSLAQLGHAVLWAVLVFASTSDKLHFFAIDDTCGIAGACPSEGVASSVAATLEGTFHPGTLFELTLNAMETIMAFTLARVEVTLPAILSSTITSTEERKCPTDQLTTLLLFACDAFESSLAFAHVVNLITCTAVDACWLTGFFFALRPREAHFTFADSSFCVALTTLQLDVAFTTAQLGASFHKWCHTSFFIAASTRPGAIAEAFTGLTVTDTLRATTAIFPRAATLFAGDACPRIIAYTLATLMIT